MFKNFDDLQTKIKTLNKDSKYFPEGLKDLSDCPDVIYVLGNEQILNSFSVSIVGTRNSSDLGNSIAFELSKNLSYNNITIVSGLACGIDTQSHLGTIPYGKTIAVIACGFNHIFNSKNSSLIYNIVNNGGAIITEYPENFSPKKYSFLKRNRLIAAISKVTVVVEAPIKSGSLNTAHNAQKLNRKVFAIPWNINTFRGEGCNILIKNGANILINYTQILDYLHNILGLNLNQVSNLEGCSNLKYTSNSKCCSNLKYTSNLEHYSNLEHNSKINTTSYIPKEYMDIYKFISKKEFVSKEDIYLHFANVDISEINSKLTLMEIQDIIKFSRKQLFYKLA